MNEWKKKRKKMDHQVVDFFLFSFFAIQNHIVETSLSRNYNFNDVNN
jgi:hypothetical protein